MAGKLTYLELDDYLAKIAKSYDLYGPVVQEKAGVFSDTDTIIFEKVNNFSEMCFDKKSNYSAKDIFLPLSETIFYFTENEYTKPTNKLKPSLIFVRSCDLHAIKRTDQIYLYNKYEDIYYKEKKELLKFVLVGCKEEFDNCHCVDFATNISDNYDIALNIRDNGVEIDIKDADLDLLNVIDIKDFMHDHVSINSYKVNVPDKVELEKVINADIWDEYSTRCIACGACNFVCPTCTCFTMQDIFYQDNENVGERRRVAASCHVDGYSDMAGGHSFRLDKKDRMRFKVLHKVSDFKERFGYNMCVGCGRCDDVCPEHISFANSVNKLTNYIKEGENHE
ncbi:anaerobic sulfite reductase subunit AsrA [Mycoplasma sp. P36-A1]|uniref:anaerobic sulfite reductase subunit AsrA n=1 Tax=Mycoplasma sp. P36-A1 TaxID=3252900 RepID=UPI003C2B41A1